MKKLIQITCILAAFATFALAVGNICPRTTDTESLGTASLRFSAMYVNDWTMESGDSLVNSTDDELTFASNDDASTINALGFEAKDAIFLLTADEGDDNGDQWQIKSAQSGNALTIANDTSGSQVAKLTLSTAGLLTITGGGTFGQSGEVKAGYLGIEDGTANGRFERLGNALNWVEGGVTNAIVADVTS